MSNPALAAWLSTHCFKEHKSLYSFCQQYIRDQSDAVFDASEDLYEMNACFAFLCTSPDALETTLEELQQIIFPSSGGEGEGEMIQTDFYRIKREERFGLVVRNALRVLQCTFEQVSRVYDACLEFKDSEEEEEEEGAGSEVEASNRFETRLAVQRHHAYFDSLAASRLTKQTLPPHHVVGETLRAHSHLHRKAVVMPSAVLELAKLHHRIPGNQPQCLMAVREAICVAQQNLDQPVLDKSLELLAEVTGQRSERDEAGRVAICRDTLYPPTAGASALGRAQRLWRQIYATPRHAQCLLRSDAWEQFGSKPLALAWNQCLSEHQPVLATCRHVAAEFATKGKANLAALTESLSLVSESPLDVCLVVDTTVRLVHEMAQAKMDWPLARRMHFLSTSALGRGLAFTRLKRDAYAHPPLSNGVEECHRLLVEARLFHRERALVLATRSWALAHELQLKSLAALAVVEIARAKLEMKSAGEEVKPLLKPALQHLVAHGTLREARHAQLWEIKAQIKIAPASAAVALEAFAKLAEREELLDVLEETYYLLARVLHDLDRVQERDEASRRCLLCGKRARREEEVVALQTVAKAVLVVAQS